jgi:hypothetical protein
MPESITIILDGTDPESDDNGRIDISIDDYTSTPNDAQDITFVDGGNWTSVLDDPSSDIATLRLEKMGNGDNQPDNFRFNLSTFNERFDITIKSEGPEDTFIIGGATSFSETGGVYTINYQGSDGSNYVVILDPGAAAVTFVCFTPGTPIETSDGPVDVADLRPGDMVVTRDNGAQPIQHVLHRTASFGKRDNTHKPILLSSGCLGPDMPRENLVVSPQHRVLLSGPLCREMFDAEEVLAPAKGLLGLRGVRQKKGVDSVDYIALVLEQHEVVTASNYPSETLLLAPYTIETLCKDHKDLLGAHLSKLAKAHATPARPLLSVRQTKNWVRAFRQIADSLAA